MTKIEIAKEYTYLHKDSICDNYADITDSEWENLYEDMVSGEYGEVRPVEGGEFEIEIPSNDTNSGNPIIFTFEKA